VTPSSARVEGARAVADVAHRPHETSLLLQFDESTSNVLRGQYVDAERFVNTIRIAVLGALSIAAVLYSPHLSLQLNLGNFGTLAPVLAWAILQHVVWHGRDRSHHWLRIVNPMVDVTGVTAIITIYGLAGDANMAIKAPIFGAYFIILAARPFTGSPQLAVLTTLVAMAQYASSVSYLVFTGRLELAPDSRVSAATGGTAVLDEGGKLLLLLLAGTVAAYATHWGERTLRRAVSSRRDFEARFRAVFEHSGVGVAMLNARGAVLEANTALGEVLGLSPAHLVGRPVHELARAEDQDNAEAFLHTFFAGVADRTSTELRFVRRDGSDVWTSVTISRARGARDVHYVAMVEDVTERKRLEARLLQQAFYDGLTGLANRALFRDRVEHALARTQRERAAVTVLFLDLDNFKNVNDTLGHAAGDNLLVTVGGRLLNATRGADTVARLGGDEFAVLLENAPTDAEARVVAERITNALRSPVELSSGTTIRVASSIGIARADGVDTVDELLRNADVAMYAAKSAARGSWVFFDPSMHTALVDRVTLEADMRKAIESDELWVAYQPIVDLTNRKVTGLEALVRWTHPTKGTIPPSVFIPVAEETGLIIAIGRKVLREACQQVASWTHLGGAGLSVTVNLSARQLQHPQLLSDVQEALSTSSLDAGRLIVEITESVIMEHTERTLERLRALKHLGVRLAIDDFGTGYSSLSYLQQFPVDILKIDRSFTTGLSRGPNEDALARTIIALGELLTLRTIAEGVEQEGQHERLRDLGCDFGQGFLFGHPLPAREVAALLARGDVPSHPPREAVYAR
jgi:diguanylate cyclase (GGDEF)-like protein/PAS domain S-box-containing protein